jgi:anti-anti-sigma regulatory factor
MSYSGSSGEPADGSAQSARWPLPLASSSKESEAIMIVPVFVPPSRIDATNVAAFVETVREHLARHRCMVIDCSGVVWIAISGMSILEIASHDTPITLVNPCPAVHLIAATFGGDVRLRYDGVPSRVAETDVPRRYLTSVHTGDKVAS